MGNFIGVILGISAILYLLCTFVQSISRTKSAARWLKGYNFNTVMSEEEVLEFLKRLQYPEIENVSIEVDGNIVLKTKLYSYLVEISADENGNTRVGLLVDWAKLSRIKSKKVAFDWDNVYMYIKQENEGIDATQSYEKKTKLQKTTKILGIVCLVAGIIFMLFS